MAMEQPRAVLNEDRRQPRFAAAMAAAGCTHARHCRCGEGGARNGTRSKCRRCRSCAWLQWLQVGDKAVRASGWEEAFTACLVMILTLPAD